MKKLAAILAIALVAISPAVATAQTTPFSGKWEGTFTRQNPDGTAGPAQAVVFNLTQKGNVITGTAGPDAAQQFAVEKGGKVTAGKATFDVQQPNGPLFKFTLTIAKGHMTGDMLATRPDGTVGGHLKVDVTKAVAGAKK